MTIADIGHHCFYLDVLYNYIVSCKNMQHFAFFTTSISFWDVESCIIIQILMLHVLMYF